jgi:hypothetical protein
VDAVCKVEQWQWEGQSYLITVSRHSRGTYTAETELGPGDRIISDGRSAEDVLRAHRAMLPLALLARGGMGRLNISHRR